MVEQKFAEKIDSIARKLETAVAHRCSFDRVPFDPRIEIRGVPQAFLSGFSSSKSLTALRIRLKNYLVESMDDGDREAMKVEQTLVEEYRREAKERVLRGEKLSTLKAPSAPLTNRLEALMNSIESELTQKVVEQMSPLSKRFLEAEFQLLESHGHREMTLPRGKEVMTTNISNFFARLEAATSLAIEEREGKSHLRRVS